MLFNSYIFIFAFLPIAVGGYFLLGKWQGGRFANAWLVLASLFFYGYWNIHYLPLLLISILMNYAFGALIMRYSQESQGILTSRLFFSLGMLFDLGLLGYFKYMDFFIKNMNRLFSTQVDLLNIVLPLGISFFSITQMVYLIGVYFYREGREHRNFVNYCLFVSFFPHLLAGPILYHKDMMRQFDDVSKRSVQWDNMAKGMSLFIVGLFKKVVIADSFIITISNGFSHAEQLTLVSGWVAALSFFFQMYYDFSGYSDMAVGAAKMMNIDIPINFNSPFHARNLIEFWSRWHISLTSTITAYIYTPLVMSFKKVTLAKSMMATFVTMVIIGIWHGAGWTYVVFGAVHGIALGINTVWKRCKLPMPRSLSHALTLLFVMVTCVLFRATSLSNAGDVLAAMIGMHGIVWPGHIGGEWVFSPHSPVFMGLSWMILLLAVLGVSFGPNSNELVERLRPTVYWAAVLAAGFVFSVLHFTQVTEFLYFQF